MLIDLGLVLVSGAICFYLGRKTTVVAMFQPSADTWAKWQKVRQN